MAVVLEVRVACISCDRDTVVNSGMRDTVLLYDLTRFSALNLNT